MLNIKVLVQGMVWGIAVVAMNNACADDSSTMEPVNKKETLSPENKLKKSSLDLELRQKPPNGNETNLSINNSLFNPIEDNLSKSDEIKKRKTHYGVGYEYRMSMREQAEKTQRLERVERPERINRPERTASPERAGRR